MVKRRRELGGTNGPIELFCSGVSTRRQNQEARMRCEAAVNGFAGLTDDLWLKIFDYLSDRDVAYLCTPVCRAWREWVYIRSGKSFSFNACARCRHCGNSLTVESDPLRIASIHSFAHYIRRRTSTLKSIKLDCGESTLPEIHEQIFREIAKCDNLTHLEFYGRPGQELKVECIVCLPRKCTSFKTNLGIQHNSISIVFAWTGVTELEVSMLADVYDMSMFQFTQLDRLERLTVHNFSKNLLPTQDICLRNLKYFEITNAFSPTPSMIEFILQLPKLKTLNLVVTDTVRLPWDRLSQHPTLEEIHVKGKYGTFESLEQLYRLSMASTIDVGDTEPPEDLNFTASMLTSNLQRFVSGTSRHMTIDLPTLLRAPKIELIDAWALSFSLGIGLDTTKDIFPDDRPLCIKLDSDSEFQPEELTSLKALGFEITHSRPACACCGTALSTWFAKYTNTLFELDGLSPTDLIESTTLDVPCRWGSCKSCKDTPIKNPSDDTEPIPALHELV